MHNHIITDSVTLDATNNTEMNDLPLHITDESNGLTYTLRKDYYFPDIEVSNKQYNFSRFGLTYFDYLKEQRPILFTGMLADGTFYEHIQMIDEQAQSSMQRNSS